MVMEISFVGATGVLCTLGDAISEAAGGRVAALARMAMTLEGVTEAVPGYTTVLVHFDPLTATHEDIAARLRGLTLKEGDRSPRRVVEIPVRYGGEYGPDLAFVAEHAGLSEAEVIALHSQRPYRIYMIGFLPGFPYLGGLDERLHTPRLDAPRTRIPAGSVGIGGQQTGIYPVESPGGWRIIGRTPLKLFDPGRPPLYAAGDYIKFTPI